MVDLKEAFSTLRFGSYSATYFALQSARVGSWLHHKQAVDHYYFCLIQLLTFDTSDSGDAPPTTCLHLLYKQGERRGPQVMSVTQVQHKHKLITCNNQTQSLWLSGLSSVNPFGPFGAGWQGSSQHYAQKGRDPGGSGPRALWTGYQYCGPAQLVASTPKASHHRVDSLPPVHIL